MGATCQPQWGKIRITEKEANHHVFSWWLFYLTCSCLIFTRDGKVLHLSSHSLSHTFTFPFITFSNASNTCHSLLTPLPLPLCLNKTVPWVIIFNHHLYSVPLWTYYSLPQLWRFYKRKTALLSYKKSLPSSCKNFLFSLLTHLEVSLNKQ